MTKELREELLKAVRGNHLYDYVANNYWKLDKEDLKNILLEVIACESVDELEAELIDRFPADDYED